MSAAPSGGLNGSGPAARGWSASAGERRQRRDGRERCRGEPVNQGDGGGVVDDRGDDDDERASHSCVSTRRLSVVTGANPATTRRVGMACAMPHDASNTAATYASTTMA